MNLATWLRIVAILIGALALAALIWFGGPFLAFGDVRPFESFWVRLPVVVLLMLGALGWIALIVIRRRKATAALTEALEKEESTGDGAALSNAMRDALATLKSARGKGGDYLYDLPWYVIIGPPGEFAELRPLENTYEGNDFYEPAPEVLYRLLVELDEKGWDLGVIYHSHPVSPARPSARDIEYAGYPDSIYVICSLEHPDAPDLRAFRMVYGAVTEYAIELT